MTHTCEHCKGIVKARGADALAKALAVHEDTCPGVRRVKK